MLVSRWFLVLCITVHETWAAPQHSFQLQHQPLPVTTKPRKLHGRFLHITDMHPDPHYHPKTSQSHACHRKKPKKKKNRSGYYGTPYSDCDSPLRLTNFTLDFLQKKWASEIDFVVWTGDNARHDNDRKMPRTTAEIYDLNRSMTKKMVEVFTKRGIPVIPSLGNNDIWPHNIMTPGPNAITNEYASIWKSFIPFPYLQVFQRGAYYSVEVVPDELAIISLNTMYFYDSNKAVNGCPFTERDDPGNLEFDWLEVQLHDFRSRGMQVWLTGHVPPSSGNYFPECYVRYVELALRFQDTILGHLYGHMNADHFFFVEAVDLELEEAKGRAQEHDDLYDSLLDDFSDLPKPKNAKLDNYAVINVSPSVVPNPYLPSFRVFSYNISNWEGDIGESLLKKKKKKKGGKRKPGHNRGKHGNKASQCKLEEYRDTWRCQLNSSWFSDPEAPSRTNRLWTPLGYAQYYIPDLKEANKTQEPHFRLEYATYPPALVYPGVGIREEEFPWPIPRKNLPKSLRKGRVGKSKYLPYGLDDLTIGSWLGLGQRLGGTGGDRVKKVFRKYMYMM